MIFILAIYLAYLDDENDKKLFENIYFSYRKQMVSLAIDMLEDENDAQDAVSDVFLRIVQKNWDVVRGIKDPIDLRNYLLLTIKDEVSFRKSSCIIYAGRHDFVNLASRCTIKRRFGFKENVRNSQKGNAY